MIVRSVEAQGCAAVHEGADVIGSRLRAHAVGDQAAEEGLVLAPLDRQASLAFGQQAGILDLHIEVQPPGFADPQIGHFLLVAREAAPVRLGVFDLGGDGLEVVLEDDVDDALIRRIAEALGDLFGEDLDLLDRFGGIVRKFARARYADTVDEEHRTPAAPPTPCPALRGGRDRFQDIGDGPRPEGRNILGIEFRDGRLFDIELPAQARSSHDDQILGIDIDLPFSPIRLLVLGRSGILRMQGLWPHRGHEGGCQCEGRGVSAGLQCLNLD